MRESNVLDVGQAVSSYYAMNKQKKEFDKQLNEVKSEFTKLMDEEFKRVKGGSNKIVLTVASDNEDSTRPVGGDYIVTRVQNTSVVFDPDKLAKCLSKDVLLDVVSTKMTVIDVIGLVNYVRSLGGDAKTFKSFINITHEVDNSKIDELSEVGEITAEDIAGCYKIVKGKPWYRVTFKAAEDDGE